MLNVNSDRKINMAKEMEKLTKQSLISLVNDLNGIIRSCEYENCYNKVIQFFNLTSKLDDRLHEVYDIPLRGWEFWGIKSKDRKRAETDRAFFTKEVHKAGRDSCGINRTNPGEEVTKNDVFFGDIFGIWTGSVAKFEACKEPFVQEKIRQQIVNFIQSYKNSFKVDWLK